MRGDCFVISGMAPVRHRGPRRLPIRWLLGQCQTVFEAYAGTDPPHVSSSDDRMCNSSRDPRSAHSWTHLYQVSTVTE
jgi:hypothetical protein